MIDLTALYAVRSPEILGRDYEMQSIILSLLRQEKPNVLVLGEPGVGKTAIVHQLAFLIANQMVPKELDGYKVVEIQTNQLLAGPGYRGVTEEKFQNVIDRAVANGKVILFFDEFHTVENLGRMANGQTPGLSNMLKPYLTRGDFRVIGATTNEDYKKMTDKALLRRLNKINVSEPTEEAIKHIIRTLIQKYNTRQTPVPGNLDEVIYRKSLAVEGNNPDKAKDICDLLFAHTKLHDVKEVIPDHVDEVVAMITRFGVPVQESSEEITY